VKARLARALLTVQQQTPCAFRTCSEHRAGQYSRQLAMTRRATIPLPNPRIRRCLAVLLVVLPMMAWAQMGQTLRAVNVRAGPDPAFPLVTWLPARSSVHVVGCLEGARWCDIVAGRTRGWIHASYLSQPFRTQQPPVVTFSVEAYWDAHYRRRPWFASRDDWIGWGTPSFKPPPPPTRRRRSTG
jgi:uncharacterized protein YraI